MAIEDMVRSIKAEEGFSDNVGMILIHNGVVRGWSRQNRQAVTGVEVRPNREAIDALVREFEARPGIFRILARAESGTLAVGQDLLTLVVAGDVRENVIPVLAELLDRVKAEAVDKTEVMS